MLDIYQADNEQELIYNVLREADYLLGNYMCLLDEDTREGQRVWRFLAESDKLLARLREEKNSE